MTWVGSIDGICELLPSLNYAQGRQEAAFVFYGRRSQSALLGSQSRLMPWQISHALTIWVELMARMLKPEDVPDCLWNRDDQSLTLPISLSQAFEAAINARNLRHLIHTDGDDGPIGGRTEGETLEHFVNRFDGSSARLQLAFLDPFEHLAGTSDVILSRLSGGTTCLVDSPCGAGAGFLSLLLVIAKLRELEVLPRIQLNVRLLAADISDLARAIGAEMLASVQQALEDQGIIVEAEWLRWDVTSESSTADLVKRVVIRSDGCKANFLLVANFSGYLITHKKLKDSEPQLYELFKYFSGDDSFSVWIEPKTNSAFAPGGLLHWLSKKALSRWAWFARLSSGLSESVSSFATEAKFRPVLRNGMAMARVCVSHMRLSSNG